MSQSSHLPQYETLDSCKARIRSLFEQSPRVRMRIFYSAAKVSPDTEAVITGVYRHCFSLEESGCGAKHCHTFTYADLLTKRVDLQPLE